MSRLPKIYLGANTTTVVSKVHDHSRECIGHYGMVDCDDANCRQELLTRLGGVECVWRKWYCAREPLAFSIAQEGMRNGDGTAFMHLHKPHGQDWAFECDSPECNQFLTHQWDDWRRLKDHGAAVPYASPIEAERPKSRAQLDEEHAMFEERARQAAATEIERQIQASLWPLPR